MLELQLVWLVLRWVLVLIDNHVMRAAQCLVLLAVERFCLAVAILVRFLFLRSVVQLCLAVVVHYEDS